MKICSLPEEERPLERACAGGMESLSNIELIGILLRTGCRGKSALALAEDVLAACGEGLHGLGEKTFTDLTEIPGVGQAKAGAILAAVELGKRLAASRTAERKSIRSAEDIANLFMERLRFEKREHFITVNVNTKGAILSTEEISIGELTGTIVHPREVFIEAIRRSAAAVFVLHNHPSGDPEPSREDIETTKRLVDSGKILGIGVLDHIIIGDGVYVSLRASGIIQ